MVGRVAGPVSVALDTKEKLTYLQRESWPVAKFSRGILEMEVE